MADKASDSIPVAPGIKLENLIDFKGDCIDPLTLVIITESLDHALETSARRLKAAGKIYSRLEENPILPVVKAIRNELQFAPQCSPQGPRVVKPPPIIPPPIKPAAGKVKVKATAAELKRIEDVVRTGGEGMTAELLELVKDKPELLAIIKEAVPKEVAKVEEKKEEIKERTLPSTWGEVVQFIGKGKEKDLSGEYESPQVLANRLGIITRGAKPDMVKAFQRAGFKVTTNGDERPQKGVTKGFVVRRIAETPAKYRKIPVKAEEPSEAKEFEGRWQEVKKEMPTGEVKVIAYDWIDPVTELIVPKQRVWIIDPDTGKPTGNKPPVSGAGLPELDASQILERMRKSSSEPSLEELAELEEEE